MRLSFLWMLAGFLWAQQLEKVSIYSGSIVCNTCKKTLTKGLSKIKGIYKVQVSVQEKTISVTHNPEKIGLAEIREAIRKIGYDADSLKAYPEAFEKLPACCKAPHP